MGRGAAFVHISRFTGDNLKVSITILSSGSSFRSSEAGGGDSSEAEGGDSKASGDDSEAGGSTR